MRFHKEREKLVSFGACLAFAALAVGCGSAEKQAQRNIEVEQLRELNDRYVESLAESKQSVHQLRQDVSSLRQRETVVAAERDDLRSKLEATVQSRSEAVAARDAATGSLARSERDTRALRESLKQVQNQAAKNVEELADLRQNVVEHEERVQGLRSTGTALRKEFSRLNRELERARAELVTKSAVISSMTTGNDSQKHLSKKLAAVEAEKHELFAKYEALAARMKSDGKDVPEITTTTAAVDVDAARADSSSAPAAKNPGGFVTLVQARAGAILRGDAAWDGVDVMLTVGTCGVLLCVLWLLFLPLRMRNARDARDEIEGLQQRLYELANADRDDRGSSRHDRETSSGGKVVRRRGQFSPIISSPSEEEGAEDIEQELESLEAEDEEEFEEVTVNLGRISGDLPQPSDLVKEYQEKAEEPVSEAPAASWDEEEDEEEVVEDEFANTQIIPSLGDLDDLDDEPEAPAARDIEQSAPGKKTDDREFMAELKDLIGQKVDEMIQ